jgi:putative transposase
MALHFTRSGKAMDNGFIESFNGQSREECLNAIGFVSIQDARMRIEA